MLFNSFFKVSCAAYIYFIALAGYFIYMVCAHLIILDKYVFDDVQINEHR